MLLLFTDYWPTISFKRMANFKNKIWVCQYTRENPQLIQTIIVWLVPPLSYEKSLNVVFSRSYILMAIHYILLKVASVSVGAL